jgi:hypothetical protein
LAAQLAGFAGNPARRRMMGAYARQVVVDRHSHDTMVQRYLTAYGLP